ncbi:MAG: hypothetical protein ACYDCC_06555 [Actinomycetota bacterium]
MKTTLVINDRVLARLRDKANKEGTTISKLVESALRAFLDKKEKAGRDKEIPPLPSFKGGRFLVDVNDRESLYDSMQQDG